MTKPKRKPRVAKKKPGKRDTIKLIVKSNELVEARYMFDVWETRLFLSLLASISKHDADDKVYRVWFRDIKNNFELKSNQSYQLLRKAAVSMAGKSVHIGWINDTFRRGRLYRIFKFIDYLEDGQSGNGVADQEYIDIQIDKDIKPYLLDIRKKFDPEVHRYTSYDMRNVIKLKPYGTRLYELLKQFEFKGFRTIKVIDLKAMFLITDEYPRFSNFYQKVIVKSVSDINLYTDLQVPLDRIEKIKTGRKVSALRFKIEAKTKREVDILRGIEEAEIPVDNQRPVHSQNKNNDSVQETVGEETEVDKLFRTFESTVVKSFGITPSVFLNMLNTGLYSQTAIEQAINVTRRAKYNQSIKKSVAGFFIKALKEGFTDEKEEAKKTKKKTTNRQKQIKALQNEVMELNRNYTAQTNEKIRALIADNPAVTEQAIAAITTNTMSKVMVLQKEAEKGAALDIEDYRQDKELRTLVIHEIVEQQKAHFLDLSETYEGKIKELEKRIKKLMG